VLGLQGRLAEAEALLRQDLPPEIVSNNLAYLKAASNTAAPAAPAATSTRSWQSVRDAGG
jgi:Flp pilus assembly protein TadD